MAIESKYYDILLSYWNNILRQNDVIDYYENPNSQQDGLSLKNYLEQEYINMKKYKQIYNIDNIHIKIINVIFDNDMYIIQYIVYNQLNQVIFPFTHHFNSSLKIICNESDFDIISKYKIINNINHVKNSFFITSKYKINSIRYNNNIVKLDNKMNDILEYNHYEYSISLETVKLVEKQEITIYYIKNNKNHIEKRILYFFPFELFHYNNFIIEYNDDVFIKPGHNLHWRLSIKDYQNNQFYEFPSYYKYTVKKPTFICLTDCYDNDFIINEF